MARVGRKMAGATQAWPLASHLLDSAPASLAILVAMRRASYLVGSLASMSALPAYPHID